MSHDQVNYNCCNEPFAVSQCEGLYWDMHGLIFETSIWLLAGSTRFILWAMVVGRKKQLCVSVTSVLCILCIANVKIHLPSHFHHHGYYGQTHSWTLHLINSEMNDSFISIVLSIEAFSSVKWVITRERNSWQLTFASLINKLEIRTCYIPEWSRTQDS